MKYLLIGICLSIALNGYSQNTKKEKSYFVVLYTIGETWDTTRQYHEQKYFEDHSNYLSSLRKNKEIVMGARYSDTGMIIIEAKDEIEAKAIVNKDEAVKNKLFKAEVFLFEPFYSGCIKEL